MAGASVKTVSVLAGVPTKRFAWNICEALIPSVDASVAGGWSGSMTEPLSPDEIAEAQRLVDQLDTALVLFECKHQDGLPGACPDCMNTGYSVTTEEEDAIVKALAASRTLLPRALKNAERAEKLETALQWVGSLLTDAKSYGDGKRQQAILIAAEYIDAALSEAPEATNE